MWNTIGPTQDHLFAEYVKLHRSLCLQSTVWNIGICLSHTHTLQATMAWTLIINAALIDKIVRVYKHVIWEITRKMLQLAIPHSRRVFLSKNSFHL